MAWVALQVHAQRALVTSCSSRRCAVAAATVRFSPLWCFHPLVAVGFALVITKAVLSAVTATPRGALAPWWLAPRHAALRPPKLCGSKQGVVSIIDLQLLSTTRLKAVSTSQQLNRPFLPVHNRDGIPAWPPLSARQNPPRQNSWLC